MNLPEPSDRTLAATIADGLWSRVRDVILVAERIETFAFKQEDGPAKMSLDEQDASELSRDLILRALLAAGDRLNHAILERARADEGAALDELSSDLGAPRLVVAERVSALMTVGLARRALDSDRVFATAAGAAIVALIDEVGRDVAARLTKARGRKPDGLPLL